METTCVRAMLAGRPVDLVAAGERLEVRTPDGAALDPAAAAVIVALGGREPEWLRAVEGLNAAYAAGVAVAGLVDATAAVSRKPSVRSRIAGQTTDTATLVALAGAGEANVVRNPLCTPLAWDLLTNHPDERVVAKAWRLAVTLPAAFAEHADWRVRARVAANQDCPPDVLADLARDESRWVVAAVAGNPATPPEVLDAIASERDDQCAEALAANPATPERWLERLARDALPAVRAAAADNPSLPQRSLRRLADDTSARVLYVLAQRTELDARALSRLERAARRASDTDYRMVRWRLSHHPACSTALAERLDRIVTGFDRGLRPVRRRWYLPAVTVLVVLLWLAGWGVAAVPDALRDRTASLPLVALSACLLPALAWLLRATHRRGRRPDGTWRVLVPPGRRERLVVAPLLALVVAFVLAVPATYIVASFATAVIVAVRYVRVSPALGSPEPAKRNNTGAVIAGILAINVVRGILNLGDDTADSPPSQPLAQRVIEALDVLRSDRAKRLDAATSGPIPEAALEGARREAYAFASDIDVALRYHDRGLSADTPFMASLRALRSAALVAGAARTTAAWDDAAPKFREALAAARASDPVP